MQPGFDPCSVTISGAEFEKTWDIVFSGSLAVRLTASMLGATPDPITNETSPLVALKSIPDWLSS